METEAIKHPTPASLSYLTPALREEREQSKQTFIPTYLRDPRSEPKEQSYGAAEIPPRGEVSVSAQGMSLLPLPHIATKNQE